MLEGTKDLTPSQLLTLLLQGGITRTQFKAVLLDGTGAPRLNGKPIGQGKCLGVRLYLNSLALNTTAKELTTDAAFQVYYGDENGQYHELIAGVESKFIPCRDLEEIWIRGNSEPNQVVVTIYLGDDNDEIYKENYG